MSSPTELNRQEAKARQLRALDAEMAALTTQHALEAKHTLPVKPLDLAPGDAKGRPWFLGQQPKPVEASDAELDAEGMAKLAAWLKGEAVADALCNVAGELGDAFAELDDADLENTAPTPRGAVYRTTEGAAVPSLVELLANARNYVMTIEEREAQRQSFVRGQLAMGSDRDEAEYRRKMRADSIDYETPGD